MQRSSASQARLIEITDPQALPEDRVQPLDIPQAAPLIDELIDAGTTGGIAQQQNGKRPRLEQYRKMLLHIIADVVCFCASVALGLGFALIAKQLWLLDTPRIQLHGLLSESLIAFLLPLSIILYFSREKGHYTRFKGFWEEYGEYLKVCFIAFLVSTSLIFLTNNDFSRLWLFLSWPLILLTIPLGRSLTKWYLMQRQQWFTPTIVVGSGQNALESALAIESNALMGFRIIGLLDVNADATEAPVETRQIYDWYRLKETSYLLINSSTLLQGILHRFPSPYVVLALESSDYEKHHDLLEALAATRHNLSIIPPMRGLPLLGAESSVIFRHEVLHLRLRNNLANRIPRYLKRAFDIIGALAGLLLLSPLLLGVYLKVRMDGGPSFYYQHRVTCGGREFKCWKFRSMVSDAEERLEAVLASDPQLRKEYAATHKLKNDPRITRFGHFIRKSSIDELPQLWNVLRGDMSLVGPRPVKTEELKLYGSKVTYYLETPPGITGLWQVSGRNDVAYSTRVNLDAWYVRNWSLWYDITILMKTVSVVVRRIGVY